MSLEKTVANKDKLKLSMITYQQAQHSTLR